MNEIINNFANLENIRNFIIQFIIDMFTTYISFQCLTGKYLLSICQFNNVISDFKTNISLTNTNFAIYIYKFMMVLSNNKLDEFDNIKLLTQNHQTLFNIKNTLVLQEINVFTKQYDTAILQSINNLKDYKSTGNILHNEFIYINPEYFNIIMKTYSKTLTLSNPSIEYNHNYLINILNENIIYCNINEINKQISDLLNIEPKPTIPYKDIIKKELLLIKYKNISSEFIPKLLEFNIKVKEIFNTINTSIKTFTPAKYFILEGGSYNKIKLNTRKIKDFIVKTKKTIIHKRKKTKKINNESNIKTTNTRTILF